MKSPIFIFLLKIGPSPDTEVYAKALREAILGDVISGVESLGPRELLEVTEFREITLTESAPGVLNWPQILPALFETAVRRLVVVLDARSGIAEQTRAALSTDCETHFATYEQTTVLTFFVTYQGRFYAGEAGAATALPPDSSLLRFGLGDLDERDLQIPFFILHVMHQAIRLLASHGTETASQTLKLFFSHAKRDGVPFATSARSWMARLHGFSSYYDTENLDLNQNIDTQLESAIANGIVIVFRTEVFDQRYWCRKEVLWAEKHGRPVITVDARWHLQHGPSVISFDAAPAVRVPDGSVLRVFMVALCEAFRVLLFAQRVNLQAEATTWEAVAIPRAPSIVSLRHALLDFARDASVGRRCIVYPNPALPQEMTEAAQAFAAPTLVKSFDEFRLELQTNPLA